MKYLSLNTRHVFNKQLFINGLHYKFSRKYSEYPPDDPPNIKLKRIWNDEIEDLSYKYKYISHKLSNWLSNSHSYPPPNPDIVKPFPYETDVLIIGGGIMGSSVAYWLTKMAKYDIKIVVLEKDTKYTTASSILSMGGIRQQFSLEENIQMSLFGAHFLRNVQTYLKVPKLDPPNVFYHPQGYLVLASPEGAEQLHVNHVLQKELGVHVKLMSPSSLREKFPWLNTQGIELGSYGLHDEGWFDPYDLMMSYKTCASFYDVQYLPAQLLGFETEVMSELFDPVVGRFDYARPVKAIVNHRCPDGSIERKRIQFAFVINAAGYEASHVASMLDIGTDEPGREIPLPVEPRKRYVYVVHCPEGPGLDCPFLIDNSGIALRRDGLRGNYLVMLSPKETNEPSCDNKEVDHNYFYDCIWPLLAKRIPCFEKLKLVNSWCGYYDYNFVDQNAIIGYHPYHQNFLMINGFSGHGAQHSPAAGRALAELLLRGKFSSLDLKRFRFERFSERELLFESHII